MNQDVISYKYKDEAPLQTINKVRNCLAVKNILATESWNHVGNNAYSVNLFIPNTQITANGKGISTDLALASAYGELVERLSLLLPFRVSPFYSIFYKNLFAQQSDDFDLFYETDFKQWLSSAEADCFFGQLSRSYTEDNYKEFWGNRYNGSLEFKISSKFSEFVFKENDSSIDISLPMSIVDYYYGSNGMCAGNTPEEALVQGISEIIERYVQKKIIRGQYIQCYDITRAYLAEAKELENTIQELMDKNYTLTLIECVSELPMPVICAILKKQNGEYYVSFGCHPCIRIGAERAITELLQGYNLQTLDFAFSDQYLIQNEKTFSYENYMNLVKFGKGAYPIGFINAKYPTKKVDMAECVQSNKQLLQTIYTALSKAGYKIYLCKGIDMGLSCFHVIIPGLSEVQDFFPPTKIRADGTISTFAQLNKLTANEAQRLAELCAVRWENGEKYLEQLISVDKYREYTNCHTAAEGINSTLFISLLYIKAQKWSYAIEYIDKFCDELLDDIHIGAESIAYYRMVRNILEMISAGWDEERICQIIQADNGIRMLVNMIITGEKLFDNIPDLSAEGLIRESKTLDSAVKAEIDLLFNVITH